MKKIGYRDDVHFLKTGVFRGKNNAGKGGRDENLGRL
jgi:hypothetical protein